MNLRATGDTSPLPEHPDAPDLLHGGALYRVLRRFGVEPEHAAHAARRGALAGILLWAPMAVAAFFEGTALPGRVRLPFLFDVAEYVRPLVAVPLLLVSEPILAGAWRRAGMHFRDRGIVGDECREAYDACVDRVTRASRRLVPEIVCLGIAGVLAARLVSAVLVEPRDAWYATRDASGGPRLTLAGAWAGFAVHGILFYLSLRWLWLLSLWYRFLLGVVRLPLRLFPAHPDRAAGLGFVGWTIAACAPLIFAWSAALAAAVANHMIHAGVRLVEFAPLGAAFLVFVLVVFVLPPTVVCAPCLARTRRLALEEWSRRMARRAEAVRTGAPSEGATEEGGDGSSLEDLEIAVSAVRAIRPIPFAWSQLVGPLAAAAAPVVALLFVAFPAKEIFHEFVRLVM